MWCKLGYFEKVKIIAFIAGIFLLLVGIYHLCKSNRSKREFFEGLGELLVGILEIASELLTVFL